MDTLKITKIEYPEFKNAYQDAMKLNKDVFKYKDQLFLIGYAKYLIEHLDRKFNV